MKIAVTGSNGRLGRALIRQGCIPLQANVTDYFELQTRIQELDPEVIIHCAAMTHVDGCENAPVKAAQINMGGVYYLAQAARDRKIVYLSTDYIFSGHNGPYRETDSPNPISIYGWSKLGGEIALRNRNSRDLIVRTTILFDRCTRNFVTAVIDRLQLGLSVTAPDTLFGNPTYIPDLARGILAAIEQDASGILNLAGNKIYSRFRLAQIIAELLDLNPGLIETGPVTGAAPRPLQAGLIVEKAIAMGLPIGDPVDGLKEIIGALETVEAG